MRTLQLVLKAAAVSMAIIAISACGKHKIKPPPSRTTTGLPGIADRTAYCAPDADGKYSEAVTVQKDEGGDQYIWGQGGSCVLRPVRETWAVAFNHPLMMWAKVSSSSATLQETHPDDVNFFYLINYVVHNLQTITWDMDWYHAVINGDVKTPHNIIINYKMTTQNQYMHYWEGSIWIDEVTPNVTAVRIRNQVNAWGQGLNEVDITVHEVLEKFRTGAPNFAPLDAAAAPTVK